MSDIESYGITIDVPRGWDGRITRRPPATLPESGRQRASRPPGTELPVVHVGTFPLPEGRGDFGSGAVERMRPTDVLLCITEFGAAENDGVLFQREGVPAFHAADFHPDAMQRTVAGMCGAQAFFTISGRAFCAYAVLGSHRARASLAPKVNATLASLRVAAPEPAP